MKIVCTECKTEIYELLRIPSVDEIADPSILGDIGYGLPSYGEAVNCPVCLGTWVRYYGRHTEFYTNEGWVKLKGTIPDLYMWKNNIWVSVICWIFIIALCVFALKLGGAILR
jgi:hypothetical protein